ncbi:MAG: YigZ family protein [Treponema sp.]|nr:YigZ family protein [Treponema sp.]
MDILTAPAAAELTIRRSRFLAELVPCVSARAAREKIKLQKQTYPDAAHVVHAFIVGTDGAVCGMSDDGEPAGTAARPSFDVLKGRGCTNILLTVTRWFGGTLLGTGGLVSAYGDSAKAAIRAADTAGLFEPYVARREFAFTVDYARHGAVRRVLSEFHVGTVTECFEQAVFVSGRIDSASADAFCRALLDVTQGTLLLDTFWRDGG